MRLFAKIWQSCPAGDAIPGHRHSFPTGDQVSLLLFDLLTSICFSFPFSSNSLPIVLVLTLKTSKELSLDAQYAPKPIPSLNHAKMSLHDRPDPPKSTYLLLLRHLSSRGYLFVARRGFLVALLNKDICLHSWIRTMSRRG